MIKLDSIKRTFLLDQSVTDIDPESVTGAVIGGWVDMQGKKDIALQYKRCADHLVEEVDQDREFAYQYAYPIIYLYRHFVELRLKSFLEHKANHAFDFLLSKLLERCEALNVQKWVTVALSDRINEFNSIDNNSTRFRYGSQPAEEFLVDFSVMRSVVADMEAIFNEIEAHSA